jgi:predicted  nucleic acid-binding Zn-ribbon protein
MPHQCVRCNTFYGDGALEIIQGCNCGGKLFFYIKPEKMEAIQQQNSLEKTDEEKVQMEKDVFSLLGIKDDEPVVLDIEAVNVISPGKYELDVVSLFKGEPVVFKLEEGKYIIDVAATFQKVTK